MTVALRQTVVGYRLWIAKDGRLCALDEQPWPLRDVAARCRHHAEHNAPENDCGCGLYALHEVPENVPNTTVLGAVIAWGGLQIHPDGFRAAHARPIAIASTGTVDPDELARIAKHHDAPLVPLRALEAVAHEFGQEVPMDQRPVDELFLLETLARALTRRERCSAGYAILDCAHDAFCHALLGLLASQPGSGDLRLTLETAWRRRVKLRQVCAGRGMLRLRATLTDDLHSLGTPEEKRLLKVFQALDAAHGPVRRSIEQLVACGRDDFIPDPYLLHPDVAPTVVAAARERARARLDSKEQGLLPGGGDQAVLVLEPELDDSELKRLLLRMRSSYHLERLLEQAGERRPGLAAFALERSGGLGARAAAKQLGRAARPLLLRQLRRNPGVFSLRREAVVDAIVGDTALRLAAERSLRLARDSTDVVQALALLPGREASAGLAGLLRRVERLSRSAESNLRTRTWNLICTREHLVAQLSRWQVRAALRDGSLGLTNHALLLRTHPDADNAAAERLWRHPDLNPRFALDILRATGPAILKLASETLADAQSAKASNATAARLAASLVVLSKEPGFEAQANAIATDADLPATVRAVASFLLDTTPGSDPALRRYQRWCSTRRRHLRDPLVDLLSGAWQAQVLL